MSSKKILHLIDHMGLGGAQRIVSELSEPSQDVYALRKAENTLGERGEKFQFPDTNSSYNLRCILGVFSLMRQEDYDVLHCHLKKAQIVGIVTKLFSTRDFDLIFHEHGRIFTEDPLYEKFLAKTQRYVDRYIAVSEKTKSLMQEKSDLTPDKIEVLYNFADQKRFNPHVSDEYKREDLIPTSEDSFTLGFAGRLVQRKGWRDIINAHEFIEEDVEILIAGSGPEEDLLKESIMDKENINYLGYLEDIRTLFNEIDCFVIPSEWDPCPMISFEVQAVGIPLICADVPSLDELIVDGKNGLLYESKNAGDLARTVNRLKNEESLQENLSDRELQFADSHNLHHYKENLEKIYRKQLD